MSKTYRTLKLHITKSASVITLKNATYEILADSNFIIVKNNDITYGYPLSKVECFYAEGEN